MRAPAHLWAPLLVLAAACSEEALLLPIDLSDAPSGVGFLAVYAHGDLVREVGPFGIADGNLSFGMRPQVELQADEEAVVLVVPTEAIEAAAPGFTSGDLPEAQLTHFGANPPILHADGRVAEELALPTATRFWRAQAAEAQVSEVEASVVEARVGGRGLQVLYDPESCRPPGSGVLSHYGAASDPLAAMRNVLFGGTLVDVHIVDDDHLLVIGEGVLVLVTRDEVITEVDWTAPPPRAVFVATDFLPARIHHVDVEAVAIDPTSPADARRALVIAADVDNLADPEEARSLMAWVSVTQDGLSITETATVVETHLRDVDFAPDGSWMATGDYGLVLFGAAPGAAVTASRYGTELVGEARRGAWTPDPARPWVVSARSAFYSYYTTLQRWVAQPVRGKVDENLHFVGLAAAEVDGQVEIWSGGASGLLYASRGGREFEFVSPRTPPRLGSCSQQLGQARPVYIQGVTDINFAEGQVFIASDDCTAIMQARLSDGCTSLLTIEDTEILSANRVIRGIDLKDGRLVGVGRDSKIWETTLR